MSVNAFGQGIASIYKSTYVRADGTTQITWVLDMGGNAISNLTTPSSNQDATNKAYADTKLAHAGGSMTGNLTMSGDTEVIQSKAPSANNSLCNKTYVDTQVATKADKAYVDTQVATKADKAYVDIQSASKLNLTGGTLSGSLTIGGGLTVSGNNIVMGSGHEVMTDRNPSSSDALCRKGYVDTQDSYKLSVSGGSMTGNLTMSGTTKVIQATAPTTANSLCNKSYVDNAVDGKVSKTGGTISGNVTVSDGYETFQSSFSSMPSSLCNKDFVDTLFSTGTKLSDMLVNIGSSSSRTIGCTGVTSRQTLAGYGKIITLNLGNSSLSSITSTIGVNPQYSSLSLVSPGKTSFANYVDNNSLAMETAKIEAAVIGGVTKGLLTMNGNISLGSYNTNKVTNSADPTDANDLANKNYVDTMIPVFKTVTGTLGSSGQDTVMLQCTAAKNPQNNKIYLGKVWIERETGEWFSIDTPYVASTFGSSFQFFYRASTMKVSAYFGPKPAGWTCNYRLDYIEYP